MQTSDVYITHELALRQPGKPDHLSEKLALQELAARMADQPDIVLSTFTDLALAMTGGVSAGLSILEPDPPPGVFRWQHLRGKLARFNEATTPRDHSPCGVTLDSNAPVLSAHPERVYNWISDAAMVIPEVLLVPLRAGSANPFGTLWIVADQEGHFDREHARMMTELAAFVGIALRMLQSERKLRQALDRQSILVREMDHRVNNLFALLDGLIHASAREASGKEELAEALSSRLHALASAHALIREEPGTVAASPAWNLEALLQIILEPHQPWADRSCTRFTLGGPAVRISRKAASGLSLLFHELRTNAVKYGALKHDDGRIEISWRQLGGNLDLRWAERGGPQIGGRPAGNGFGTTLMSAIVEQFRAALEWDWQPSGLAVTITMPLEALQSEGPPG